MRWSSWTSSPEAHLQGLASEECSQVCVQRKPPPSVSEKESGELVALESRGPWRALAGTGWPDPSYSQKHARHSASLLGRLSSALSPLVPHPKQSCGIYLLLRLAEAAADYELSHYDEVGEGS